MLTEACPGALEYYDDPEAVPCPPIIAAVQVLLDLTAPEVEEALCVGFLAASVDGRNDAAGQPDERWARQVIAQMNLGPVMEYNLSFGIQLTERATAALEDPVAQ